SRRAELVFIGWVTKREPIRHHGHIYDFVLARDLTNRRRHALLDPKWLHRPGHCRIRDFESKLEWYVLRSGGRKPACSEQVCHHSRKEPDNTRPHENDRSQLGSCEREGYQHIRIFRRRGSKLGYLARFWRLGSPDRSLIRRQKMAKRSGNLHARVGTHHGPDAWPNLLQSAGEP